MPREHVAIVDTRTASALIRGTKRIETRFYRQRRAPFGRIAGGDNVHFKISGVCIIGTARVTNVREFTDLSPAAMDRLQTRYRRTVLAPGRYWKARRNSRYGVLIWLEPLHEPAGEVVVPRQYGGGWVVLRDK